MVQRTVLKVDITCQRCKKKLLKSVSGLEGVDKVEADAAKGTLTVTGNADPYEVIVRARKAAGRCAEVESIGPPPNPTDSKPKDDGKPKPKPKPKPDDDLKCQQLLPLPSSSCHRCERVYIHVGHWDEPNVSCSIL
ncbi:heavy metal-associated isoprenylated plant protein 2-like [Telopea speciosissima]|uniref:heavy metal-associated isoprenylated plant protein 2-like n=1 Tax=Telopea speciosissima TaxID=54955 RepID=UPI001CC37FAB|nr:heavy metal-associated isoprenylated plant protein 2-like [Telopea speciosissima]